jgi:hypothetical protein
MEHSCFYLVRKSRLPRYTRKFIRFRIPFALEDSHRIISIPDGYVALVFPDLPARQYQLVFRTFGYDGLPYPHV